MKCFGKLEDLFGIFFWLVDEFYFGFVIGIIVFVDGGFMVYLGV